jgi:hypothetical protein
MKQSRRDLLLAYLERAKGKMPATHMVMHLLGIDAERGCGNDGLPGIYQEEAKEQFS